MTTETEAPVDIKQMIAENRATRKHLVAEQVKEKKILRTDWRKKPEGVHIYKLQWSTMARRGEITRLLVEYHYLCGNEEKAEAHRYK